MMTAVIWCCFQSYIRSQRHIIGDFFIQCLRTTFSSL